jgi:hypothetical protein
MEQKKPMFVMDFPTPDGFGIIGFVSFSLAVILIIFSSIIFGWQIAAFSILLFILGGFSGRGFEQYSPKHKDELYEKKAEEKNL